MIPPSFEHRALWAGRPSAVHCIENVAELQGQGAVDPTDPKARNVRGSAKVLPLLRLCLLGRVRRPVQILHHVDLVRSFWDDVETAGTMELREHTGLELLRQFQTKRPNRNAASTTPTTVLQKKISIAAYTKYTTESALSPGSARGQPDLVMFPSELFCVVNILDSFLRAV